MTLFEEVIETTKGHEFKITAIIFILLALNFNSWTVWSDGHAYFAILESIVQDKDLDLTNQFHDHNGIYLVTPLKGIDENRFVSPYAFGAPLLNAPLYAIALTTEKIFGINTKYNNYNFLRTASVNITANILALITILFCFTTIKKIGLKLSALSMLCLTITTPLFFYATMTPSFPHAADAFALSALLLLLLHFEKTKKETKKYFWPGLLLGFATSIRYYNAFLVIPTILFFALQKQWKKTLFFALGFAAFAWTIPIYWQIAMGEQGTKIATTLATDTTPSILPTHAIDILLNPIHGLLIWSPIIIFSLFGFWIMFKKRQTKKIALLVSGFFITLVLAYGRTEIWSAGWSYSARYLTGLFPVFAIGFAAFETKFGKTARIIAIVCLLYSAFLLLNETFAFIDGVNGTPANMLQNWLSGKTTIKDFANALYKFTLADNIVQFFSRG
jgi:hypothetical protein